MRWVSMASANCPSSTCAAQHIVGVGKRGVFTQQAPAGGDGARAWPDSICARATPAWPRAGRVRRSRLQTACVPARGGPAAATVRCQCVRRKANGAGGLKALHAQGGGRFKVFLLNGIEIGLRVDLRSRPGSGARTACWGEGFEQIAVQGRLGGFRHCGIRGLGGDHENTVENGSNCARRRSSSGVWPEWLDSVKYCSHST